MTFLTADDDRIAIPAPTEQRSGTEILHGIALKGPSILPRNGAGLHVAGGIKVRVDLHIYAFQMLISWVRSRSTPFGRMLFISFRHNKICW